MGGMLPILTVPEGEDLAARTLAAIDKHDWHSTCTPGVTDADRERVTSDLEGLRECWAISYSDRLDLRDLMASHARRYSDGLRRTAALYGGQS